MQGTKQTDQKRRDLTRFAMSQSELGQRFGVSLQMIQHIEYRALRKIRAFIESEAKAAGCTPRQWLFGE